MLNNIANGAVHDYRPRLKWEKAARGTDGQTYPWCEGINCDYANVANCVGDTVEVGTYPLDVSPYGVFDMGGDIREFVEDWFNVYPGGDPKPLRISAPSCT